MKIICIGRNYGDHAKEMKSEVPEDPIFFLKPDTALFSDPSEFYYPTFTNNLHYECEVVVKISKMGKCIPVEFAKNYYQEFTLGIDFTARDLQENCKIKGLPWEKAKSFDFSAPISKRFLHKNEFSLNQLNFSLQLNNQLKQKGNTNEMIFSIDELISYVSQFVTLKTGDLIFTGTPAGVGTVKIGDLISGEIEGQKMFEFVIK